MQRVTVNMKSVLMGQAVEQTLKNSGEFYTMVVPKPEEVTESCGLFGPDILLMEVGGSAPWRLDERMHIRDHIKERDPNCKVVLVVDENTEKQTAERVKQAKRDGLIDQFIYGSSSAAFLVALLETV